MLTKLHSVWQNQRNNSVAAGLIVYVDLIHIVLNYYISEIVYYFTSNIFYILDEDYVGRK